MSPRRVVKATWSISRTQCLGLVNWKAEGFSRTDNCFLRGKKKVLQKYHFLKVHSTLLVLTSSDPRTIAPTGICFLFLLLYGNCSCPAHQWLPFLANPAASFWCSCKTNDLSWKIPLLFKSCALSSGNRQIDFYNSLWWHLVFHRIPSGAMRTHYLRSFCSLHFHSVDLPLLCRRNFHSSLLHGLGDAPHSRFSFYFPISDWFL